MSDDDLAYVLRCQSKRTDIPIDVVRTLSEAYAEIISMRQLLGDTEELRKERDSARRDVCYAEVNGQYGRRYKPQDIAKIKNWDCFTKDKTP